ncbi:hypothetical protein AAF712_014571 [Marasmius tenuissimus]|uniref:Uncharacterized protein n=1 Tax=Marasmius tenuissimus TaxID=585030 RepID=A0ABR2ZAQ0_9AGAR
MQRSNIKPTEDMEHGVREFERTLVQICDSITELTQESRTKCWGYLLFANKTKELAGLRKELEDAHIRFMVDVFLNVTLNTCGFHLAHGIHSQASNMFAVCLEVKAVSYDVQVLHHLVRALSKYAHNTVESA